MRIFFTLLFLFCAAIVKADSYDDRVREKHLIESFEKEEQRKLDLAEEKYAKSQAPKSSHETNWFLSTVLVIGIVVWMFSLASRD